MPKRSKLRPRHVAVPVGDAPLVKLKPTALQSPERSVEAQEHDANSPEYYKKLAFLMSQRLSDDKTKPFHEQKVTAGQVGAGFLNPRTAAEALYTPPSEVSRLLERTSLVPNSVEDARRELHLLENERRSVHGEMNQIKRDIRASENRRDLLTNHIDAIDRMIKWQDQGNFKIDRNDCARMHKLQRAFELEQVRFIDTGQYPGQMMIDLFKEAQSVVVTHDWAAALGEDHEAAGEEFDFRLPYPVTSFEFRVSGMTCIIVLMETEEQGKPTLLMNQFMELSSDLWVTFSSNDFEHVENPSYGFLWRQIRAICIALEAEVVVREVIRAPLALNAKRIKNGKPPLKDYSVVNLARRHRINGRTDNVTGRRVRLHYRRGHWRNYENHKTWIKWMLVGNPDLGFLAKHYTV